jgi:hypothetical protein
MQYHTEIVRRERSRYCEVCGHYPATITVSRWDAGTEGDQPAESHYFCNAHAVPAEALLQHWHRPELRADHR